MKRKIWIISDTHFNHDILVQYCGRPIDFEQRIFKQLSLLDQEDMLIHLGDICLGKDQDMHNKYITPLKCRKILVKGNHDHKSNTWYLNNGWDFVCKTFKDKYFSKKILFSHKPMIDDGYDLNIHGHFHNNEHHKLEPDFVAIKNDKQHCFILEHTNYSPELLKTFISRINKSQM